jgi:hypothetical protein
VPGVQALLPAVSIRTDGTIAVFYYDMRNDTADPATLLVDAWLATSTDGITWAEVHVAGPFDFDRAPAVEGGLFIGDYQGLAAATGDFTAFYAQTHPDPANPTDIYASGFRSIGSVTKAEVTPKAVYRARSAAFPALTEDWKARLEQSVARTLAGRRHGAQAPANGAPANGM